RRKPSPSQPSGGHVRSSRATSTFRGLPVEHRPGLHTRPREETFTLPSRYTCRPVAQAPWCGVDTVGPPTRVADPCTALAAGRVAACADAGEGGRPSGAPRRDRPRGLARLRRTPPARITGDEAARAAPRRPAAAVPQRRAEPWIRRNHRP